MRGDVINVREGWRDAILLLHVLSGFGFCGLVAKHCNELVPIKKLLSRKGQARQAQCRTFTTSV